MEGTQMSGSMYRIKQCGVDLLQIEEDLINNDDEILDDASWEVIGSSLCLKSTFLFFDFNRVVVEIQDNQLKQTLIVLANQLLLSMKELCHAVRNRSKPSMLRCCNDAIDVLKEVMALLPYHCVEN